jgi:shikimate dehydrogenase
VPEALPPVWRFRAKIAPGGALAAKRTPLIQSGKTKFLPILAHPVEHVRAPRTYNPAFEAAGLDWFMLPMGVRPEDLESTLAMLARVTNLQGATLTIPHKAHGWRLCRLLGAEARRTRMVNTMRLLPDGTWAGDCSDGVGFVSAARAHGVFDAARPVAIVGAGGAGTAIALSLAAAGVRTIAISDTDGAKAEAVCSALRREFPFIAAGTDTAAGLREAGLAINATPMGLEPGDPPPFDAALLRADAKLFDIVSGRDTELMIAARARGLTVVGGQPMVEHQVVHQIAFWRGDPAIALEPRSP